MDNQLAYWAEPEVNPNFQSHPPDPGAFAFLKNAGWDAMYHSPFSGVYRMSEMAIEGSDYLNPGGNVLQPQEANDKYGMGGQLKFDEPIKEDAARLMLNRKVAENDRAYISQSGATTGFRQVAGFGVGMAASLVDPVNVATMFVPAVGEARMAALVARHGLTKARLIAGAVDGLVGSALAEPFILLPALQEQANYGLKDSAMNLGFGAILGAGLHAGLGAIADKIRAMKPKEANAIFESAMNDVLQDRPVASPAKIHEFTDSFEQVAQQSETIIPTPETKETISAAAIKLGDGRIETGVNHAEIIDRTGISDFLGADDGFVTNTGRFVSREEAAIIAESARQVPEGYSSYANKTLESDGASRDDAVTGLRAAEFASVPKTPEPTSFTKQETPSINDIPLRDAHGKFLSKAKRLELLNEKINADSASRESLRGQKKDIDTKTITSSDNPDIPSRSMDSSDVTKIDSQTADLQAELKGLDPEEAKAIKQQIDELTKDIGNPAKRAKAVEAATNCIISRIL